MAGGFHADDLATLDLDTAVRIHRTSRCFPPIPERMHPFLVEAIEKARDGAYGSRVTLPASVTWRGQDTVPVHVIVNEFRLHDLIPADDD